MIISYNKDNMFDYSAVGSALKPFCKCVGRKSFLRTLPPRGVVGAPRCPSSVRAIRGSPEWVAAPAPMGGGWWRCSRASVTSGQPHLSSSLDAGWDLAVTLIVQPKTERVLAPVRIFLLDSMAQCGALPGCWYLEHLGTLSLSAFSFFFILIAY